jgi:hypothetical protein
MVRRGPATSMAIRKTPVDGTIPLLQSHLLNMRYAKHALPESYTELGP